MSFALTKGPPTKAQLYLDTILDDLVAETKQEQDRYSIAKIIFKCMRDNPDEIRQIDGSTGKSETNKQVIYKSVRTALAMKAAGLNRHDIVIIISRNHLDLSGPYYGCIFGGFILFPLHVGITPDELKHYVNLSDPRLIFTDQENLKAVEQTLKEIDKKVPIIILGPSITSKHTTLSQLIAGIGEKRIKAFWPSNSNDSGNVVMLMSTSGSTGLPKAVKLSSIGFVSQLATGISNNKISPKEKPLFFYTGTAQWVTQAVFMLITTVYGIPLLTISEPPSVNHIRMIFKKCQPRIVFIAPTLLASVARQSNQRDFSSLDTLILGGVPLNEPVFNAIKAQVGPETNINNAYGMTETYGPVIMQDQDAPYMSPGKIINTVTFKIVDESGNTLGPNQPGELYLRSKYVLFKEYLNNEKATKESFTEDGWFKTGDKFYVDESGYFFFLERIKYIINYDNYEIYPSELEAVICDIEGVQAAAVCGADKGPGALVMVKPWFHLDAQTIHDTIQYTLRDYKRLRGGVVFVPSIPLSINAKVDRNRVKVVFENACKINNEIHYDKYLH